MDSIRKNLVGFDTKGYTLIELMVAVGIMGILAVSATALFFSAIRGGSKVDVSAEVKQNGQQAMNAMEQMVRNALRVNSCQPVATTSLSLTARDGGTIVFSCEDIGADTGHLASNSARLTSDQVVVTSCSFTCSADASGLRGPLIEIDFSLRQAGTGGDVSETATADFSTSVGVRNL